MSEEHLANFMNQMFIDYVLGNLTNKQRKKVREFAEQNNDLLIGNTYYELYTLYTSLHGTQRKQMVEDFKEFQKSNLE